MRGDEGLLGQILGAKTTPREGVGQTNDIVELSSIEALKCLMTDGQLLIPGNRVGFGNCGHDITRIGSLFGLPKSS